MIQDDLKAAAARDAVKLVRDRQIVGLGSGSTCKIFIIELGRLVRNGLDITGVPTSKEIEALAGDNGIKTLAIDEVERIDIAVDGADEIDMRLNLIKGYGGALLREKIVASKADNFVIIADESKLVEKLGDRGIIPVEIKKNGCEQTLKELGRIGKAEIREKDGNFFVTDNGNLIADLKTRITDPSAMDKEIKSIEGVLETGLFISMADFAIIGTEKGVLHMGGHRKKTGVKA
ncbi:MAG: ribose 5-phosphate isomerase A [Candidatus Aenigmarchaeota archaeon]|nr:ribose 5-phosphate isomerase A [Candidatus Aenigmarchaeota archaeon]